MKRSFSRLFPYVSLTALVLAGAQTAYAAPVLPEAPMSEAADFLSRSHNGINAIPGNVQLSLAYTADAEGTAAYYIFNHQNGFVIVSADDRLPSVLGYSDNGCFDPDRTPENMKWWLGEYQREFKAWHPPTGNRTPLEDKMESGRPLQQQLPARPLSTRRDRMRGYGDGAAHEIS